MLTHPDLQNVARSLRNYPLETIFFVGAGLSHFQGFPLWHQLLFQLIDYGLKIGRLDLIKVEVASRLVKEKDYLGCGSYLRQNLTTRLDEKMTSIFQTLPTHAV